MAPSEASETVDRLYRELFDLLRGYLCRKLYDADAAYEIAQESFVRLLTAFREGKSVDNPKAYLFRSAHNLLADQKRKQSKGGNGLLPRCNLRTVGLEQKGSDGEERTIEVPCDGWFDARGKIDWHYLGRFLTLLRPRQRHIFDLHFAQGMHTSLIAVLYKTTDNAMQVELSRIRKTLRDAVRRGIDPLPLPRTLVAAPATIDRTAKSPATMPRLPIHLMQPETRKRLYKQAKKS